MTVQLPELTGAFQGRRQLSATFKRIGLNISPSTLSTMATRGGGPPFLKWGPRVVYRWEDALEWAEGRLSRPRRSTSEADAS